MHANDTNNKIIYPVLSYKITGILFSTHNELDRYCKEKQYQDLFEDKLRREKINYEREKKILISPGICGNQVDFCVENKILIDFKAKKYLTKEDYYQMKRYLTAAKMKLGLVVNFRDRYLKPKRILN
ncbi:MAG: GxxExxY protein [Candidatus Staskawiczbacteria bacterium]|nr:GxxExxY protein [Candidatus Staskawiczbacteria bacterium]